MQRRDRRAQPVVNILRQFLFGKIDRCFRPGERSYQTRAPSLVQIRERALILLQRLSRLRRSLGIDEIGERFAARQIELAILDRAARELARLRGAQPRHSRERGQDRLNDRAAAMRLKFGQILAGLTCRTRKPKHQRLIDPCARAIAQRPQRSLARHGQIAAAQCAQCLAGIRP